MTRIISPLARVQIGGKDGDVFVSGDGILQSVSVELGEDKRSSKCQVVLFDKDLLIGGKYQAISFAKGGIEIDSEVLKDTTESKPTVSSTPVGASSSSSEGSAKNTNLSNEERSFLDLVAYSEGTLGRGQEYNVIVGYKYFSDYSRHPDVYVKSADSTAAGRYQFLNTTWNGQRGKPGLKQILGLKDFSPNSQDLGAIQLIKEQGALADVKRGSAGLEAALYKCRAVWASFPASPYNQPRRQLSDLKNKYINFLLKYQSQSPAQASAATQPQTPTTDKNQPAPLKDKANSKPIERSIKGTEIIVELGFSLSQMIAFHFVHIGTNTTRGQLDQTTFEGQSIRWLLTRRTQNTAYTKITLRQLAQMICDRYGLRLEFEGNGPTYQYLDATGISDYELLLREAQAIGYSIRENANTLIIKPIRPNFTGFVITRDIRPLA